MKGHVRTLEKCSLCQGKFQGQPLHCPKCFTTPKRFFVDISWPGQGRIKLYSGQDGHPLDSYERASRLLTAIRYEIDRGKFDPREYVKVELKSLRFDNYVEAWLEKRDTEADKGRLSREYQRSVRSYCRNYLIPFFQNRSIRDLREGHIEDFVAQLPEHLSTKTVFNILGILRKLFYDAHRRRDIARIPYIPKVELDAPRTKWITEEEQQLVLDEIKHPILKVFYMFLMRQGCRPGEARALRWEEVDLVNGVVVIQAAMDQDVYRPRTKERDVRPLPLHPEVQAALKTLPRCLSGFVFSINGEPIKKYRVWRTWNRAATRAGVEVNCYQGTRHSLASQAINSGCPKEVIGKFLGHKDPRSTDRYAHLLTETLKGVWNRPQPVRGNAGIKGKLLKISNKE